MFPTETARALAYLGLKDWNIISIRFTSGKKIQKIYEVRETQKIIATGSMNSMYKIMVLSISE